MFSMYLLSGLFHSEAIAHSLLREIRIFLSHLGLPEALNGKYDSWIYTAIVAIVAFAVMWILRFFFSRLSSRLHHRPKGTLIREMTDYSLPKIGQLFGGKHYTTVMYACEKIEDEIKIDKNLAEVIDNIKDEVKE